MWHCGTRPACAACVCAVHPPASHVSGIIAVPCPCTVLTACSTVQCTRCCCSPTNPGSQQVAGCAYRYYRSYGLYIAAGATCGSAVRVLYVLLSGLHRCRRWSAPLPQTAAVLCTHFARSQARPISTPCQQLQVSYKRARSALKNVAAAAGWGSQPDNNGNCPPPPSPIPAHGHAHALKGSNPYNHMALPLDTPTDKGYQQPH